MVDIVVVGWVALVDAEVATVVVCCVVVVGVMVEIVVPSFASTEKRIIRIVQFCLFFTNRLLTVEKGVQNI